MGLPINFNPYAPVPNGPFYSTQESTLAGPWYPLVVGAGLAVNYATSTLAASVSNGGTSGTLPAGFLQMAYNPTTGEIIYWS